LAQISPRMRLAANHRLCFVKGYAPRPSRIRDRAADLVHRKRTEHTVLTSESS
jgi:hypothetical protein